MVGSSLKRVLGEAVVAERIACFVVGKAFSCVVAGSSSEAGSSFGVVLAEGSCEVACSFGLER